MNEPAVRRGVLVLKMTTFEGSGSLGQFLSCAGEQNVSSNKMVCFFSGFDVPVLILSHSHGGDDR